MANDSRSGRPKQAATEKESIRVHVGLNRIVQARLIKGGDDAIDAFAKRIGLHIINTRRLERFGVLTGDVAASHAEALADEEGVDFVEKDSEQKVI